MKSYLTLCLLQFFGCIFFNHGVPLSWNSLLHFAQYILDKNCSKKLHVKIKKVAIENSWKQLKTLNNIYFEYLGSCKKSCPNHHNNINDIHLNGCLCFTLFNKW